MRTAILPCLLAIACSPAPISIDGILLVSVESHGHGINLSLYPGCSVGESCPPYSLCSPETLAADLPSPIRSQFAEGAAVHENFYRVRVSGRPLHQKNARCDFEVTAMIEAEAVSPETALGWRGQ